MSSTIVRARLICSAAMVLALTASVSSQTFQPANILDGMDAAIYLNSFKTACVQLGYDKQLSDPAFKGTVFAPVDLGFDELLRGFNVSLADVRPSTDTSNATGNSTVQEALGRIVKLHLSPGTKNYPLATMADGTSIPSLEGSPLIIKTDTPGIVHVYGSNPETEPLNFATVLQYQEIRGGTAVLYVIDRVLLPPNMATITSMSP